MIRFVTPYSFNRKLLEAIDYEMSLARPGDWVCFLDGDTMFLQPDFGHQVQDYIATYPDTGLFTCYASRCHYASQVPDAGLMQVDSILFHHTTAEKCRNMQGQVVDLNRRIAGHLMVIKKETWAKIRGEVMVTARGKNILGVDTKISNAILKAGMKIRLMKGVYILHYLRMKEGFNYTKHLE